jgi:uncharacterized protein
MDFQVFVKPAGAACNLACRYCYYLEKAELHPSAGVPRMPADLLESYIVQHLEASGGPVTRFSWHGGEPTVLGLDYFREIVGLQRRHKPPGRLIANGIQTNGLLVDEAWARFFAAERFSVGLSLDGPADLHDPYRVTRGGEPTHARVLQALERLQRHRVAHDILCTVHDLNVRHPLRVYRFFRQARVRAIGFLPVVESAPDEPGGVTRHTVPAEAYGEFLCAIFDEWVARDAAQIEVQAFEEATRPARGLEHSLCILRETCGDIPVVEHTGDVYSCDHFVSERHRIGNLREARLADLLVSPRQRAFGLAKRDTLPLQCRTCDVLDQCHGGCPKDRFLRTEDGDDGLNYLCPAFKRFYRHAAPFAARVAAERRRPTLAELVPDGPPGGGPRNSSGGAASRAGRNDPCPCGSGKKFKQCCASDR